MKLAWFFFKMLFHKTGFGKALKKLDQNKLEEYKNKAIAEEDYKMAAILKYYIEFKKQKELQ